MMFRSIRVQIVALVGVMLTLAMAAYLVLATRIVSSDKEATLYDVSAMLARTLADELHISLEGMRDKLRYFGAEQAREDDGLERRAKALFSADDEVLGIAVWRKDAAVAGGWRQVFTYDDPGRLDSLNMSPEDLATARKQTPVNFGAVVQEGLLLQNSSVQPDLALLRVSAVSSDGQVITTALIRPERILRVARRSGLYRVYLVDGQGLALAHPDASKVLGRADLSQVPVVKDAMQQAGTRGAREYDAGGEAVVASWARIEGHRLAVVVEAPRAQVFKATEELTRRSVLFAVAVVSVALIVGVYFSRFVTRPLRTLQAIMGRVSQGELGAEMPQAGGQSEVGAVVGAFNTMSRVLKQRADEIDAKNAQLIQQEKLSAIGELAAGLAHEVKNPMVGIVGFAQLGQEATSMGEAKEYFQLIDSDAQRANGILQNLLEFARPPDVKFERVDVNAAVEGAVKLCAHQLQIQGVKLEAKYTAGLPPIWGNANQLRQVLLNLLMNAQQAMAESRERAIDVATLAAPGGVQVTIRDTGPGMTAEVRKRLFEPFFTTKARGHGTGLGLSVSASIVKAHKGAIVVESEPGHGATFRITLPVATDQELGVEPAPKGATRDLSKLIGL